MENPGNNQSQSRFMIAAVLSLAILFGWSYFFSPKAPPADNSNTAANTNTAAAATPAAAQPTQAPQQVAETTATTPDTTPSRTITIKSPLYEVTLDSKGAVATSWVILKNKS